MPVDTRTELLSAVARGDVDAILGTRECEWLDFKEKPYNLASPKGRRDLVADCAAFANHTGGVIVCGVREKRVEQRNAAVAESAHPIKRAAVDEDRIRDLVRANARPLLQLELTWSPGEDSGLFAIIIPSQPDHAKPFLVARMAGEDDDRDVPHAFGWPVRHGAGTHWETVDRTQLLIADGLRHQAQIDRMSDSVAAEERTAVASAHRVVMAAREEWQQWPLFMVSAFPTAPVDARIEDFFGAFYQGIQRWHGSRSGGFDLGLDDGQTRLEGGEIRTSDDRGAVHLARTGVVTAAAVGSPDMLGWASHPQARETSTTSTSIPMPSSSSPTNSFGSLTRPSRPNSLREPDGHSPLWDSGSKETARSPACDCVRTSRHAPSCCLHTRRSRTTLRQPLRARTKTSNVTPTG